MAELGGPLPGCQMCPRGTGCQLCPAHTHSPSQTRTRRDIPLPCRGCVHAQPLLHFFWAGPVQPKNLLLLLRGAGRGALGCAPGGRSHVSARAPSSPVRPGWGVSLWTGPACKQDPDQDQEPLSGLQLQGGAAPCAQALPALWNHFSLFGKKKGSEEREGGERQGAGATWFPPPQPLPPLSPPPP